MNNTALAQLRHLYQNMVNGAVRDTASAKRIAEGLLAPAIEALERGTPQAVAGEPVASVHSDTLAMLQSGQCRPWDGGAKLHPPGKARFDTAYTHLYTTPQPTQAQAGAVPLTDEQIKVINTRTLGYLHFARAIEHAHGIGIKDGDSHGLPT